MMHASRTLYLISFSRLSAHESITSQYTVHVSYEDIYKILVFLIAAYAAGLFTKAMGMPSLVGEICTGFLVSEIINVGTCDLAFLTSRCNNFN